MTNKFLTLLRAGALALAASGCAQAQSSLSTLTPLEKTLYVGLQTATVADYLQTRSISKMPERFREGNPLLGDHPSMARVNGVFLARVALQHYAVSVVPKDQMLYFLVPANIISWTVVARNEKYGVPLDAKDSVLHTAVSFSIGAATKAMFPSLSPLQATLVASTPGFVKELTDKKFSAKDMGYNVLGAYLGQATANLVFTPKDDGMQVVYSKEF